MNAGNVARLIQIMKIIKIGNDTRIVGNIIAMNGCGMRELGLKNASFAGVVTTKMTLRVANMFSLETLTCHHPLTLLFWKNQVVVTACPSSPLSHRKGQGVVTTCPPQALP
jgi:hypothetical protein